jgi:hypothetical protein
MGRFKATLSQTTKNYLSSDISYSSKDIINDELDTNSVALKLIVNPINDLPAAINAL